MTDLPVAPTSSFFALANFTMLDANNRLPIDQLPAGTVTRTSDHGVDLQGGALTNVTEVRATAGTVAIKTAKSEPIATLGVDTCAVNGSITATEAVIKLSDEDVLLGVKGDGVTVGRPLSLNPASQISGVAAGTEPGHAVNLEQLNEATSNIAAGTVETDALVTNTIRPKLGTNVDINSALFVGSGSVLCAMPLIVSEDGQGRNVASQPYVDSKHTASLAYTDTAISNSKLSPAYLATNHTEIQNGHLHFTDQGVLMKDITFVSGDLVGFQYIKVANTGVYKISVDIIFVLTTQGSFKRFCGVVLKECDGDESNHTVVKSSYSQIVTSSDGDGFCTVPLNWILRMEEGRLYYLSRSAIDSDGLWIDPRSTLCIHQIA